MVMMIVVMAPMNHQNIAKAKVALALVTFSLVTTAIAFHASTFVMVIMIVWITAMKTSDTNAVSFLNHHQSSFGNNVNFR